MNATQAHDHKASTPPPMASRTAFLAALLAAYELGVHATKKMNFGRRGFSKTDQRNERRTLDRLLRSFGWPTITDAEYTPFNV